MIQLAVVLLWFVACSIQDLLQRHISNLLTVGGAALAFLYMLWSGHTLLGASAAEGGWALLIALLLTLPGYALNKLGAGDVKLLMALALATDRPTILGTVIGAGICSGLCWFFASKILPSINQRVKTLSFSKDAPLSIKLPFAPFLFAGFALTVALLR
ncbi:MULTISPECIES: prepilin peptidase [Pseudomonas]|uniref:prepilin peptidase n=1 Tax=Pseudomonas TaxID=286 RepID=UPI000BA25A67|nr:MULTISPECIES: prepilin peptidase [Pseudomonas]AOA06993.1 peptidase A24 [Pseudomonas sp. TMW 2.1634]PAA24907.1 prepilin peptidase [Pseudomonas fragi]